MNDEPQLIQPQATVNSTKSSHSYTANSSYSQSSHRPQLIPQNPVTATQPQSQLQPQLIQPHPIPADPATDTLSIAATANPARVNDFTKGLVVFFYFHRPSILLAGVAHAGNFVLLAFPAMKLLQLNILSLLLLLLMKVKETDRILTLYCWLEEYWTDEFLRWTPENFGGIKEIHIPAEMLWRPDLLVYNNANMNVKDNEMQTNALVRNDGRVSLFRAIITDITCNLNLHRFPFDQQICFLMLASWSYDASQIMIKAAEEDVMGANTSSNMAASLTHYIPNMEWTLVDFKHKANMKFYDCCTNGYPDLCYFFAIKRNSSYYFYTLIVPTAFISLVTIVGFFTPHSSTGENTEKRRRAVTTIKREAIRNSAVNSSTILAAAKATLSDECDQTFPKDGSKKLLQEHADLWEQQMLTPNFLF
uniref:Neurotransmitter-gated ion-channel ligand-binding domain-containing protein n=1 Tax=Ditylenchus dipsaci TaxID=166011 RepID=A0A915ERH7_9BILA